ncbi:Sepiapterin reductase [Micromonospora sp. MH33]|nr:Sepiapterin reductase [Micromonospora sp. MH33]
MIGGGRARTQPITPEDFRAQVETNLFGPLNVTRAVLSVMRAQRSGLVVSISSVAGFVGAEFTSAYAAAKFGLEGWMESLTQGGRRSGSEP